MSSATSTAPSEASNGCLSDGELEALVEGALTDAERARIGAHVDGCPTCRELVAELARSLDPVETQGPLGPLRAGELIGRYRILEEVGSGGMGIVYSAFDPSLDRRVALKVWRFAPDEPSLEALQRRLAREARTLARVAHPNVVTVFDVVAEGPHQYFTMEYVEGTTLARWLSHEPRRRREILEKFLAAGLGLSAAHASGIIHSDFKPENVLISKRDEVKVTDFGLARLAADDGRTSASRIDLSAHKRPSSPTTTAGGTPGYMAPEQRKGRVSARSDQYAFAVALHQALYGKKPLSAEPERKTGSRGPRTPSVEGETGRLATALRRALSDDDAARFPSMDPLLAVLEAELTEGTARYSALRTTIALGAVLVAVCAAVPVGVVASREEGGLGASPIMHLAWMTVLLAMLGAAVTLVGNVTRLPHNRGLARAGLIMFASQALATAGGMTMGLPFVNVQVMHFLIQFVVVSTFAAIQLRRLWPASVACLLAYAISARWPELRFVLAMITNVALLGVVLYAWRSAKTAFASPKPSD